LEALRPAPVHGRAGERADVDRDNRHRRQTPCWVATGWIQSHRTTTSDPTSHWLRVRMATPVARPAESDLRFYWTPSAEGSSRLEHEATERSGSPSRGLETPSPGNANHAQASCMPKAERRQDLARSDGQSAAVKTRCANASRSSRSVRDAIASAAWGS